MSFKFETLDVWKDALDYLDLIYSIAEQLPRGEDYNLRSQIIRAATSVGLNIAEGSTGQTDLEHARFLGLAIRSLVETVACQHIISRRGFLQNPALLRRAYSDANRLARRLQVMRRTLVPEQTWLREESGLYEGDPSLSEG